MKTWHLEWLFIAVLLLLVAHFTHGIDASVMLWLVATLAAHGIRSISARQTEKYQASGLAGILEEHRVECFKSVSHYSFVLALTGAYVGWTTKSYHGMVALGVQLIYPFYRKLYRKLRPAKPSTVLGEGFHIGSGMLERVPRGKQ